MTTVIIPQGAPPPKIEDGEIKELQAMIDRAVGANKAEVFAAPRDSARKAVAMNYADMSEQQRRKVVEAAIKWDAQDAKMEYRESLGLHEALQPPSPLPSDAKLREIYNGQGFKVSQFTHSGACALYAHALRLAAGKCRVDIEALAAEMESRK